MGSFARHGATASAAAKASSYKEVVIFPVTLGERFIASEADERMARYARLGKLVDVEDVIEIVCARLKDSAQLRYLVEDAIADPHDTDRPRVHASDALRMAQDVLVEVVTAVDEQISVLDVVED
jgi:hypothetical protein